MDTQITNPADNEYLKFSSGKRRNSVLNLISQLSALSDVSITSVSANQFLHYIDNEWRNITIPLLINKSLEI